MSVMREFVSKNVNTLKLYFLTRGRRSEHQCVRGNRVNKKFILKGDHGNLWEYCGIKGNVAEFPWDTK